MTENPPHKPVLLQSLLDTVAVVRGTWIDCTFGAGGFSTALVEAGAELVIGIDCDPDTIGRAEALEAKYGGKFRFCLGRFGEFDQFITVSTAAPLQGVVFDLGASSMQFDQAQRGFSLRQDGPLDMRMNKSGLSAADLVNKASESTLAEIFKLLGEASHTRKIAREIIRCRTENPIHSTTQLASVVERIIPVNRKRRIHPATTIFQALRIAVNGELIELAKGLVAAERLLCQGGYLAVISFHSLEDRIVKRFIRGQLMPAANRHSLPMNNEKPRFRPVNKRPIRPDDNEVVNNPRSRSARLRVAMRTAASNIAMDFNNLGVPQIKGMEFN